MIIHKNGYLLTMILWIGIGLQSVIHAKPQHASYHDSLVLILSAKQPPDLDSPWQKEQLQKEIYIGATFSGGKILTLASAVKYAMFIEVRFLGQVRTYPADVLFVDEEVNLALLQVRNTEFIKQEKPIDVKPMKDLLLSREVSVFKIQDELSFSEQTVHVLKMAPISTPMSHYAIGSYFLEKPSSESYFSGPLFFQGKLRGFLIGQGSSFLFAIPDTTLFHFLSEAKKPKHYQGFPGLGIVLKSLRDPDLRSFLSHFSKYVKSGEGVRVDRVITGSPFDSLLKQNDILLTINGYPINDSGEYLDSSGNKIPLVYLINQFAVKELVKIQVIRAGKLLSVQAPLSKHQSAQYTIPPSSSDYLIFGGLLFQELSVEYLKTWGDNWTGTAPDSFVYLYAYENEQQYLKPGETSQRVVVLNRILADEANQGYSQQTDVRVDTVNGQPIHSLEDVKQALRKFPQIRKGKSFAVITCKPKGTQLILSYEDIDLIHERIAQKYKIPKTATFFSPKSDQKKSIP